MNTIKTRTMKMETKIGNKMVSGKLVVSLMIGAALMSLGISPASAAFSDKDAGTRGAQFLKLPVGAKYIGMGEVGTATADDANAIYYNVAGLARLTKKSGEYMFGGLFLKDKVDGESDPGLHWVSFAMPISESIGSVGLALQYFSYGDINKTDIRASKTGTFAPTDLAFNLAYARMLSEIALGIDIKIISSKIENSATTVGFDLGAQYAKLMEEKLMLGFAVQNLGGSLKYETENTKLPILIKLGTGYKVKENWVAGLDIAFPEDNSPYFGLGTDYTHKISDDISLAGRAGYTTRTRRVEGLNGITIGIGFGFKMANLDYAWMPMGDLGTTHRISVGVKF